MSRVLRSAVLLALGLLCCDAQLRVIQPREVADLFRIGGSTMIPGTTATFGAPMYGETVLGRLVYNASKTHHCENDYTITASSSSSKVDRIPVVLVERGDCTFVTKVRVAQEFQNAGAVIVMDTNGLSREDVEHIIMADDGYGSVVRIPSMLISTDDGLKLKNALADGKNILVELSWDVPQRDLVSVDFWGDSGLSTANNFMHDYAEHAELLGPHLRFLPHFHLFDTEHDYNSLCWADSKTKPVKICAEDPDGVGSVTGQMVVEEDLRQLCIFYKVHRETDPAIKDSAFSPKFWAYVDMFGSPDGTGCPLQSTSTDPKYRFGEACSYRIMQSVGINVNAVKACVADKAAAYEMLRTEVENMAWSVLAVRINGWRFSGVLDPYLVSRAVCSGFVNPPPQCKQIMDKSKSIYTTTNTTVNEGYSIGTILIIFAVFIVLVAVAFFFYQQYLQHSVRMSLREEVMLEVKTQMQDYHQLNENDAHVNVDRQQKRPLIL